MPPEPSIRIAVKAKPRAKKSRITRAEGLSVDVALAAPPVDGAANDALVSFLAEILSVPRRSVSIAIGASSRQKVVAVVGISEADAIERLARAAT